MFKDYFIIPWKEIKQRRVRSWLTLLGIIIGIAAIVSLITLGQGLQNAIQGQFSALGNDKLFISAKGSSLTPGLSVDAVKITKKDVDVVKSVLGVKQVAAMSYTTARIEYNNNVRYFFIMGMPTEPAEMSLLNGAQNYKISSGRNLQKGDKYKAVLGYAYTKSTLFEKDINLNNKIILQNQEFRVAGFLERIGSPPDDQSILIPFDTYSELFKTGDQVGLIVVQTQEGENVNGVAERITKELGHERRLKEGKEDFTVQTSEQLASSFSTILDIVQVVLIGIAGISLLVGGVGIMNTMFTSVLERTKEIGILKAVGAQNKHIMFLFLVESGLYGLGGGLIGVILGIGTAKLVGIVFAYAVGPAFLVIKINFLFVLGTLFFSFLIGCISGIAPARRASKLNPVESLRYE
ncbi:ABC transporter permease [Candidatus Woesearchaeota archaeon]|nr:ABC transporter permease [Candidatus Woesearchaeota archaeon]